MYQCLFFENGIVAYWENIEAETESCVRAVLVQRLSQENWELAEAWLGDTKSFRVEAPSSPR